LAKQTRQPFPCSSISTSKCFSLIHCDIWGRYKTPSISGAFYFLTIVDDFSRFTWVFLMRNKSETQTLLRQFFHYVHTQFNTKVQKLHSDNGAEFLSLNFFFLRKAFFFNTLVYINLSKMVSLSANIDTSLKLLALYVFNLIYPLLSGENVFLLPSILLIAFLLCCFTKKTPFEILYNKLPDYSRMRVFGCVAFATIVNPSSKFSPRATKCIFLGYPIGQKAYKLYDIATQKIFTNRDVVFLEDTFYNPPQVNPPTHNPPALSIPLPIVSDSYSHLPPSSVIIDPFDPPISSSPAPTDSIPSLPEPPSSTPLTPPAAQQTPVQPDDPVFPEPTLVIPDQPLRRSQRPREANVRLKDYVCSQVILPPHQLFSASSAPIPGTKYPLCHFISYNRYSPSHLCYIANVSRDEEPPSYELAMTDPKWQEAMNSELQALIDNQTWSLVPLPPGKRPISCK
jgi:hypothetical protein